MTPARFIPIATWSGTLVALSPITHGGHTLGVRQMFRSTPHLGPSGRPVDIPNVSGGNIRGVLRRFAATCFLDALGSPSLPYPQTVALRRGGVVTPVAKPDDVLNAEKQAQVRDLILPIAAFGGTGGGRIMSGALTVANAVPAVDELRHSAHLYPPVSATYSWPSVRDILHNIDHSRVPDSFDPHTDRDSLGTTKRRTRTHGLKTSDPSIDGKQLYSYQVLIPGTELWHDITLEAATPVLFSFMRDVIERWSKVGYIGGRSRKGYGRVQPQYELQITDFFGAPMALPDGEDYDWRAWVDAHRSDILAVLAWFK